MNKDFDGIKFDPTKEVVTDFSQFILIDPKNLAPKEEPYIMVSKRYFTLMPAAVKAAPGVFHNGCAVSIRVSPAGGQVLIQPDENGLFKLEATKTGTLKCLANPAIKYLEKHGIEFPATYKAEWHTDWQAWVGTLEIKQGE